MINKISLSFAAIAAMGLAGAASAQSSTDSVTVNVEMQALADLWSNDANLNLVLSGANAENSAGVASSLSLINNVAASIDAEVAGTLPAPIVPGGGINFFLFPGTNDVSASLGAMSPPPNSNSAYNPPGSLAWTQGTLGTTQQLADSTEIGINTSIAPYDIVYAANAPGEMPLPGDWDLTVTYTFVQD